MEHHAPLSVILLAAGKGTRMKSDQAKVLHEVFFAPMIQHVLQAVLPLDAERNVVVIGHQRQAVEAAVAPYGVRCVVQEQQLGTGHAVLCAQEAMPSRPGTVMILCGDTPLIHGDTLAEMYECHQRNGATLTLMTTLLDNPANYGRILRDKRGRVRGIVEEKDATEAERKIREINAGIYCVAQDFLFRALENVGTANSQGEVYLTDIVSMAVESDLLVQRYQAEDAEDILGVNSRVELAQAHRRLQLRRNTSLMLAGVTMHAPESITIAPQANVGRDTLLMGGVHLLGNSEVGERCRLGPGVVLENCRLGDGVDVGAYAVLRGCSICAGSSIAAHSVFPGSQTLQGVRPLESLSSPPSRAD